MVFHTLLLNPPLNPHPHTGGDDAADAGYLIFPLPNLSQCSQISAFFSIVCSLLLCIRRFCDGGSSSDLGMTSENLWSVWNEVVLVLSMTLGSQDTFVRPSSRPVINVNDK